MRLVANGPAERRGDRDEQHDDRDEQAGDCSGSLHGETTILRARTDDKRPAPKQVARSGSAALR
jgi:hypothetical protein